MVKMVGQQSFCKGPDSKYLALCRPQALLSSGELCEQMGMVCSTETRSFCKTLFTEKQARLGPHIMGLPTLDMNNKDTEFKDKCN